MSRAHGLMVVGVALAGAAFLAGCGGGGGGGTGDTTAPTVTGVSSAQTGVYSTGGSIDITVTFDEEVTVTGVPTLALNSTGTASYASGSGTVTLTFTYVVAGGENSADLDYTSTGALTLAGGTMKDAAANDADLTLPAPAAAGSLGANADIEIDTAPPNTLSITRAGADPTSAASVSFTVLFDEPVSGVDTLDFVLTMSGTSGTVSAAVPAGASSWTVTVTGVSGDGTLRLDLVDNESIVDADVPALTLGGAGPQNFTSGEEYTIDNTAPGVLSIVRAGASPTSANAVDFTVTFSEDVSGVVSGDFALAKTGTADGTVGSASQVTPDVYTVSVFSVVGDGTLRLDLMDYNTIVDVVNNPLGGAGTQNYTGDESYTIDNTGPTAPGSIADAGAWDDATPVFSWDTATDVSGVASYVLQVSTDSGFSSGVFFNQNVGNVTDYAAADASSADGSAVYARVAGIDIFGQWGSWSPASDGVTIDASGPTVTVNPLDINVQSPPLSGSVVETGSGLNTLVVVVNGLPYTLGALEVSVVGETWTIAFGTITPALNEGTYNVAVSATDLIGNTGNDSTTDELVVDLTDPVVGVNPLSIADTTPPVTGVLTDALSGVAGVQVTIGPYEFFAPDVTFGGGMWTLPDNKISPPLADGFYTVAAWGWDEAGNGAGITSVDALLVDTTGPAVTVTPLDTPDSRPELTGTVDDGTGSGLFAIMVTVDGFVYLGPGGDVTVAGTTWTLADDAITPALADGYYDVAVDAIDNLGNMSADSTTDELMVDTTPPVPNPPAPPDDGGDFTGDGSVGFSWDPATDALSGIDHYTIRVWKNAGEFVMSAAVVTTTFLFNGAGTVPGDWIYADVVVYDGVGNATTFSPISDGILYDASVPGTPSAPTDEGEYATIQTLTFFWVDDVGPIQYEMQLRRSMDDSVVATSPLLAPPPGPFPFDVSGDPPGLSYYAVIRGFDGAFYGAWSAPSDGITVDTTAPAGAITVTDRGTDDDATVTFDWTAAVDPESGIDQYDIEIAWDAGMSNVIAADAVAGDVTTYTFDASGWNGWTLYAHVMATNGAGLATAWSGASDGVQVDAQAPWVNWSSPNSGWPDVGLSDTIYIQFSEPMDTASVEAAFSLDPAPAIGYLFSWNASDDEVTIIPDVSDPGFESNEDLLVGGENYTYQLLTTATDVLGNPLSAVYSESFSTRETTPPNLLSVIVTDNAAFTYDVLAEVAPEDAVEADDTIVLNFDEPMDQSRGRLELRGPGVGIEVGLDNRWIQSVTDLGAGWYRYQTGDDHDLDDGEYVDILNMEPTVYNATDIQVWLFSSNEFDVDLGTPGYGAVTRNGSVVSYFGEDGCDARWTGPSEFTFTLGPQTSLQAGREYTIDLWDVNDTAGNWQDFDDILIQVAISQSDDLWPPEVISTIPENLDTGVDVTWPIIISFSEPVSVATLTGAGGIQVTDGGTLTVADFEFEYSGGDDMGISAVFLTPYAALTATTWITVTVPAEVEDLAGRQMGADFVFDYMTGAAADTDGPTISQTIPADGETNSGEMWDIHITFADSWTGEAETLDESSVDMSDFLVVNDTDGVVVRGWEPNIQGDGSYVRLGSRWGNGLQAGWANYGIAAAAASGGLATYTTFEDHGLTIGQPVTVNGMTPAEYNATDQPVLALPTPDSFVLATTAPDGNATMTGWVEWRYAIDYTVYVGPYIADLSGNEMAGLEWFSFTVVPETQNRTPALDGLEFRVQGSTSPAARTLSARLKIVDRDGVEPTLTFTDGIPGVQIVTFPSDPFEDWEWGSDWWEWRHGEDGPPMTPEPGMDDGTYPTSGLYFYDITITDGANPLLESTYTTEAWVWAPADVPLGVSVGGVPVDALEPALVADPTPELIWTNVDTANADALMVLVVNAEVLGSDGGSADMFTAALAPTVDRLTVPDGQALSAGLYLWAVAQQKFRNGFGESIGVGWSLDIAGSMESWFVYGPTNDSLWDDEHAVGQISLTLDQDTGAYDGCDNFSGTYLFGWDATGLIASDTLVRYDVDDAAGAQSIGQEFFAHDDPDLVITDTTPQGPAPGKGYTGRTGGFFMQTQGTTQPKPYITVGSTLAPGPFAASDLDGVWSLLQMDVQDDGFGNFDGAGCSYGTATASSATGLVTVSITSQSGSSQTFDVPYSFDTLTGEVDVTIDDNGTPADPLDDRHAKGYIGGGVDKNIVVLTAYDDAARPFFLLMARQYDLDAITDIDGTYNFVQIMIQQDSGVPALYWAGSMWGTVSFDSGSGTWAADVAMAGGQTMASSGTYAVDPINETMTLIDVANPNEQTEMVVGPDAATGFGIGVSTIGDDSMVRVTIASKP